jgi:hypothetical protein
VFVEYDVGRERYASHLFDLRPAVAALNYREAYDDQAQRQAY